MAFKANDTQLFRFDSQRDEFLFVKNDNTFEHEKSVTDLDVFPAKNLFISSGLDGFVKVWNLQKQLIREIKFPEAVYSVTFLNERGDLIVGHLGKVSTVAVEDYVPDEIHALFNPPDMEMFFSTKSVEANESLFL